MSFKILTILTCSIALLSGCNNTKNTNTVLQKPLTETHWQLVELRGKPISADSKDIYFILKTTNTESNLPNDLSGRIFGFSGCNNFTGIYQLQQPNGIHFKQIASTMIACSKNMDIESEFQNVLQKADSYFIKANELQLNRARMAPLAKFRSN